MRSAPQQPDDQTHDQAHDDHRREWREKLEARLVDDHVAGQTADREFRDPRPEQADRSNQEPNYDKQALHGGFNSLDRRARVIFPRVQSRRNPPLAVLLLSANESGIGPFAAATGSNATERLAFAIR
jgi:hypothetical protein